MKDYPTYLLFVFLLMFSHLFGTNQLKIDVVEIEREALGSFNVCCLIKNLSAQQTQAQIYVEPPEGWQILPSREQTLDISSLESELLFLAAKPTETCAPGVYFFKIKALDYSTEECFSVDIPIYEKVEAKLLDLPKLMRVGQTYEANLHLTSTSNVPLSLLIGIDSPPTIEVAISQPSICMSPGQSQDIAIQLTPQVDTNKQQVLNIHLLKSNQDLLFKQACLVEVITQGGKCIDSFHYISAGTEFAVLGENGHLIGVSTLWMQGPLNHQEDRVVDLFIRMPTDSHNMLFNQTQRFYLGIYDPTFEVRLGDTLYELSPLLERWRYGRGAEINYFNDKFELGAFYVQDFPYCSFDEVRETGAYLSIHFCESFDVSWNTLWKETKGCHNANIHSLSLLWGDEPFFHGVAEVAKNVDAKHGGHAGYLKIGGMTQQEMSYYFEQIYAGPKFFGYVNDFQLTSFSSNFPLFKNANGSIAFSFLKENFRECPESKDWLFLKQCSMQAQISFPLRGDFYLSFNSMYLQAKDEQKCPKFDFLQGWEECRLQWIKPHYQLMVYGALGTQDNRKKDHKRSVLQKYGVYWTQLFSASVIRLLYETGNISYYRADLWRHSFGFSWQKYFTKRTWLTIFGRKTYHSYKRESLYHYQLTCSHLFENNHRVFLDANYFSHPHEWKFMLSYSVPFEAPVQRRQDIGSVHGNLINSSTELPMSNALVCLNNQKVITNEKGEFWFAGILPGLYDMDLCLIEEDCIKIPLSKQSIAVRGGQTCHLNMPINPFGHIIGQVIQYEQEESYQALEAMMLEGEVSLVPVKRPASLTVCLIEVNRQDKIFCQTYVDGSFSFKNVKPGKWLITIDESAIPEAYECHILPTEIHVYPEETYKLEIKLMPKVKPVQLGIQ